MKISIEKTTITFCEIAYGWVPVVFVYDNIPNLEAWIELITKDKIILIDDNNYRYEGDDIKFLLDRILYREPRDKISEQPLVKLLDCKEFFYDRTVGLWRLTSSQYGCIINCVSYVTYLIV